MPEKCLKIGEDLGGLEMKQWLSTHGSLLKLDAGSLEVCFSILSSFVCFQSSHIKSFQG